MGLFLLLRLRRGGALAAAETCEIAMWHADGDGDFYARAVGPEGKDYVAARSLMFRWQGDDTPPSNGAILAAHNVLMQRLAWDGWSLEEQQNGIWWQRSLHRPVKSAAEVAAD
jgi:hypothetical protein